MYSDNGKYINCRVNLCDSCGEVNLGKKSNKKIKNEKYIATRCL